MLINIRGARQEHNINDVEVNETWSVSELREALASRLNVDDPTRLRLVAGGRIMDPQRSLQDYSITENAALHVVVRPPGNPAEPQPQPQPQQTSGTATGVFVQLPDGSFGGQGMRFGAGMAIPIVQDPGFSTDIIAGRFMNAMQEVFSALPAASPANLHQSGPAPAQTFHQSPPQPTVMRNIPVRTDVPLGQGPAATPATVRGTPGVPISGVYLHLHVSLNELATVPHQLEQLGQRIGYSPTVVQTEVRANPPGQAGQQAGQQPAAGFPVGGGVVPPGMMGTAAPPSSANTTVGDIASTIASQLHLDWEGEEAEATMPILFRIVIGVLTSLQVTRVLNLMGGDLSDIIAARDSMRQQLDEFQSGAGEAVSDELLAEREARRMADQMFGSDVMVDLLASQRNAGVPLEEELYHYLCYVHLQFFRLLRQTREEVNDEEWGSQLRRVVVRSMGLLLSRGSIWFTTGADGVMTVITSFITRMASSSSDANPWMRSMVAMAPSLLRGILTRWLGDYEREYREEHDNDVFTEHAGGSGDSNPRQTEQNEPPRSFDATLVMLGNALGAPEEILGRIRQEIVRSQQAPAEGESILSPVLRELLRRFPR